MGVYVDSSNLKYGRMIMCHMLADSEQELIEMAIKIGLNTSWHQYPNSYRSHFDISLTKKKLAIQNGAKTITRREVAFLLKTKKEAFNKTPLHNVIKN